MPPPATFALLALAVPTLPTAGAGGRVVLEPDRDNTLVEDASGALSNGAGDFFVTGSSGQSVARRALVHFDPAAALPPGALVTGASLTLTLRQTSSGPQVLSLHRLAADWGEGTSVAAGGGGAPATPGDATWLHTFHPGSFWSAPGGDFTAQVSASTVVDQLGTYTWSSAALAADVQAFLNDPGGNFGWILLGDEAGPQTTKLFASREAAVASERPRLTIDWVPGPVGYCTAGSSQAGCTATLRASGVPSASAPSGFTVAAAGLEGTRRSILFFGANGKQAKPWGATSSFRCVLPPVRRTPPADSGGTPGLCDGGVAVDLNAHWSANPAANPGAGALVQAQLWHEDGPGPGALSSALEFAICP